MEPRGAETSWTRSALVHQHFCTHEKAHEIRRFTWAWGHSESELELFWQTCLFQNSVCGVARLDLLIDRKGNATDWRKPNIVITLAMSQKVTAGVLQKPEQFRRETLTHVTSGVSQCCGAESPSEQLNLN